MKEWRNVGSLSLCALLASAGGCKQSPPSQQQAQGSSPAPSEPAPEPISDRLIRKAVEATLARDAGVAHEGLRVEVSSGRVSLLGSVPDLLSRNRAIRLAESVKGVRRVEDRCEVQVGARPDSELAHNIRNLLWFSAPTSGRSLDVKVLDSCVTLTGRAASHAQRRFAERLAEGVTGVRSVSSEAVVASGEPRSDEDVAADVLERLRWDALVDDGLVEVAVHRGEVKLSGVVRSAAERRRAAADAWVPGARNVDASSLQVRWWAEAAALRRRKPEGPEAAAIASAIRMASAHHPRLRDSTLRVSVEHGMATLSGRVPSAVALRVAEELARNTVGVRGVESRVEVGGEQALGDRALESVVATALSSNPHTDGFKLEVQAADRRVVLKGTVDTRFQLAQASQLASGIRGVRQVDNQVAVEQPELVYTYDPYAVPYAPYAQPWPAAKPALPDQAIEQAIRNELLWSPFVAADQVKISVHRGEATLTGRVDSPRERRAVRKNAYDGGAVTVLDRLTLDADTDT